MRAIAPAALMVGERVIKIVEEQLEFHDRRGDFDDLEQLRRGRYSQYNVN